MAAAVPQLRPYQAEAVAGLREAFAAGHKRVLLVAPTGAGKTTVFGYVVAGASRKGKRVCVLAHRRELINQASARLDAYGIDHGVIMGKHWRYQPHQPVQVASIDTLRNRSGLFEFDLIVPDEAHRSLSPTYLNFFDEQSSASILGVTATPYRADGRGLGIVYSTLVRMASVRALVDDGFLVRPRVFAPSTPDLDGLKATRGDYDEAELAARVDRADLIGDIVGHWQRICPERPTVAFAVNVAHSHHLVEQFQAAGVRAAHIDGETPAAERQDIIDGLTAGKYQLVSNVNVLAEGTDIPCIAAVIFARPTKSRGLYIQAGGRGLRPADGKSDCIILDHAGLTFAHGSLLDEPEFDLKDGLKKPKKGKKAGEQPEIKLHQCSACYSVYEGTAQRPCPECGHIEAAKTRDPKTRDGELVELDPEAMRARDAALKAQRHAEVAAAATLADLQAIERERGYKRGWAWHRWQVVKHRQERVAS